MPKEIQVQLDEANNKLANNQVKIQELEAKIAELNKEAGDAREVAAKERVETALSTGKLAKSQEAWALNYAKTDAKGFAEFMEHAQNTQVPEGEMYVNSKKPKATDAPIDMSKV